MKPFFTNAQFVFLMHRKELRDRSGTGTGRLTHQSLKNSKLLVGLNFEDDPVFRSLLKDQGLLPVVLFPPPKNSRPGAKETSFFDMKDSDSAQRLSDLCREESKQLLVFLIDGSWSGAKKILAHNPSLDQLPRIGFQTERQSQYRFKKQPHPECLSTLEATHELLTLLERWGLCEINPPGAQESLIDLFRRLVDFQDGFSPVPRG